MQSQKKILIVNSFNNKKADKLSEKEEENKNSFTYIRSKSINSL